LFCLIFDGFAIFGFGHISPWQYAMLFQTVEKNMDYSERRKVLGVIGGKVSGLKRRWRQTAIISFIKYLEMQEVYDFSQTLAQRLAFEFCGKTINSEVLVRNFKSNRDASNKFDVQKIVKDLHGRYLTEFNVYWNDSELSLAYTAKTETERLKALNNI
jgi:hypothetical protein